MPIVLTLDVSEINAILQTLGELPSKTGAYPLMMKIKEQADKQVQEQNKTVELA
jgi:hypothetical protein